MTIPTILLIERYHKRKDALAFSWREQVMFEYRYGLRDGRPFTYGEIGEIFGISGERVRQLMLRMIDKLVAPAGFVRRRPIRLRWKPAYQALASHLY